jgi:FkbM family methyltransferase
MAWVQRLRTALSRPYWRLRRRVLRVVFAVLRPDRVGMPNGRTLYLDPADARSFALWQASGNVNRRSMALWQALLRLHPWSLILDVGANHGEMLLWPELPRGAQVYAFEPNPVLAPLLRRSLADSGVASEVVEAAVGSVDGHIALHLDRRWSGTSSLIAANTSGDYRTVEVPITRLDSVLAGLDGPAPGDSMLVKIDVEGLEAEVLQDLCPALNRWDRVAIMAEVHRLPAETLDGIASDFDILALDCAGALRRLPLPAREGFDGMDVLLLPKGDAARYGIGQRAAALTASSCPA